MHVTAGEHAELVGKAGAVGSVTLTALGTLAESSGVSGGLAFWLAVISAGGAVAAQLLSMILRHRRESDRSQLRRENELLRFRLEMLERNGWHPPRPPAKDDADSTEGES